MKTYKDAGVDIKLEAEAVKDIISQFKPSKLLGHFSGVVEFGDHYLSMSTDGVGSKVLVAEKIRKYDTVGIDLVAMNVNDMICIGARPLALVDYLAVEKIDQKKFNEIAKGIAKGAELAGIEVIGGETATLPDIIKGFDLAGTCLGIVEKNKMITGEKIKEGDAIIGLESSGVHSNGLTLAREVLDLDKWGKELLKPTRIYVKEVLSVLDDDVHGCAHITGGGLLKLKRVLPRGLGVELNNPMEPQQVFKEIQNSAQIDDTEMYSTFNMGMGFALVVEKKAAKGIQKKLKSKSQIVGKVVKGEGISIPQKYVVL